MHENRVTQRLIRALNTLSGCRAKKRHGGRFQSGEPDIAGVYGGHAFFIEVKMPKGKLTPLQGHELRLWAEARATSLVAVWSPKDEYFLMTSIGNEARHATIALSFIENFLRLLPSTDKVEKN